MVRDVTVRSFDVLDAASNKSSRDTRLVMSEFHGMTQSYLLMSRSRSWWLRQELSAVTDSGVRDAQQLDSTVCPTRSVAYH